MVMRFNLKGFSVLHSLVIGVRYLRMDQGNLFNGFVEDNL